MISGLVQYLLTVEQNRKNLGRKTWEEKRPRAGIIIVRLKGTRMENLLLLQENKQTNCGVVG